MKDLEIKINERKKTHVLTIHQASGKQELEEIFEHRYKILRSHHMIEKISNSKDVDEYDFGNCIHIVATFDGKIIGGVRMIYGDIIPMRDLYFLYHDKKIFSNERIFEISRLVSAPHLVTNLVPRHLILLVMFYFVTSIAKENNFSLGVGATKMHVIKKLKKLQYPISIIQDAKLIYNVKNGYGPLKPYFEDHLQHQILPTFSYCNEAREFLRSIFEHKLIFTKIDGSLISLKHIYNFNLYLLYKMLLGKFF